MKVRNGKAKSRNKPKSPEFEPYWLAEKDWLVTCVCVDGDEEDRAFSSDWIGYVFGYAFVTNTRCLALVGDPVMLTYELLFSFDSPERKRQFLALVDANDTTRIEPEEWMVPTRGEIKNARPLALVLPKDIMERAQLIAAKVVSMYDTSGRYN